MLTSEQKQVLRDLLSDTYQEELAHIDLRIIRDEQAPRFEALKDTHPKILEDFMKARKGPHEVLLKARRKRIEILTKMIEEG